jgi:hypothetical protein
MWTHKILAQFSILLLVFSNTAYANVVGDICLGYFDTQTQELSSVETLPSITIAHDKSSYPKLSAGETLNLSTTYTIAPTGTPSYFWCVQKGDLTTNATDFNNIIYAAPRQIDKDELIYLGVQLGDDLGYVGGDNLVIQLVKSSVPEGYIIVGTNQNNVLVYSPQGDVFQTIPVSTTQAIVATKDIDTDSIEEIVVQNDATYEVTGEPTNIPVTNDMFVIQANVQGDATLETIAGSQTKNQITINGETITVFASRATRSRNTRKKPDDVGNDKSDDKSHKVDVCHNGKTINIAKAALEAHLNHGDTEGSCPPPEPDDKPIDINDEGDDDEKDDDEEEDNDRKVTICHYDDETDSFETISISNNALDAHLAHPKDSIGACPEIIIDDENFGVNVAVADFNQIVVAMANQGGDIEVISADGNVLYSFTAFNTDTGVIIAAGNILGDKTPEIIAAAVGSSTVTIFDIQGNVLNSFTIDGIVTSLAIAKQFAPTQIAEITTPENGTPAVEPEIEYQEDHIKAPLCPSIETSTNIISGCKGNGAELPEDVEIREDASVTDVVLSSTSGIEGTVSNSEIKQDAIIEGGTFTGEIINNGTLKNIHFTGHLLKGGILAGIIYVKFNGQRSLGLGNIQDVELAEDATLIGGVLRGFIKGNPDKPALILNAWIRKGAKLSHVRLGRDVKLDKGVEMGEGVEYDDMTLEDLETD